MQQIDNFNKCVKDEEIQDVRHACSLSASDYSSCITHPKRLPLLDKCVVKMRTNGFSKEGLAPRCGKVDIYVYMYFIHVRRWLSSLSTSRDQFYFLTLNEAKTDPVTVAKNILEFLKLPVSLNVDQATLSKCEEKKNFQRIKYSNNSSFQMRADTRSNLQKFFAPFNKMLSELLGDSKFSFSSES